MDTFDALMDEVSQQAQEQGVSFDTMLTSTLAESDGDSGTGEDLPDVPAPEDETGADTGIPDRVQLMTLDHLARALRSVVPVQLDALLAADGWTDSGDETYPYAFRFAHAVFTANKRTDMYIAAASSDAATNAGLGPWTDTQNGFVTILAKSVPETDIAVTFVISTVL